LTQETRVFVEATVKIVW